MTVSVTLWVMATVTHWVIVSVTLRVMATVTPRTTEDLQKKKNNRDCAISVGVR